ncbi:MAG: AAA family ATPase [Actinomycetia bacterium]|nr:AAA family ATPase [Actinomycetes bacterium]
MYTSLDVRNFRGLRHVALLRSDRVNLVLGSNGSGKTSLLEAFWVHGNPHAPQLLAQEDASRGTWRQSWRSFRRTLPALWKRYPGLPQKDTPWLGRPRPTSGVSTRSIRPRSRTTRRIAPTVR